MVNNFLYTRGNRKDFDKWQEMGNEGWAYEDVLPYFKKVEKRRTTTVRDSDEQGISDGPLNIEIPQYTTGLLPVYLRAGQELGQKLIDYNGKSQIGIGIAQGTTLNGKRMSAAGAYIYPVYKERPNLHILTSSLATKILINPDNNTAYAVQYTVDSMESVVRARKEIILSAGAIGSPHLLMLSGIGPKSVLEKANVTVIEDLPVGKSFLTNIAVQAPHFIVNTSSQSLHIKRISLNSFLQFQSGRGPLTSFTGTEALSFMKTPFSELSPTQPDVELQFVSAGIQSDLGMGFRKVAQIKDNVYETAFQPIENPDNDVWSTIVMNLHSNTKGTMKLVDNDIRTDPILKYPFFEDSQDMDTIVYGIKEALKFAQTNTFQSKGARVHSLPLASCSHYFDKDPDKYWECYVRHVTTIVPQMVATNKMGPESDPDTVVDPELRVRGIANLRVADTSIIPTTISGHLQAVSYMIGEKLADSLKRHWRSIGNEIPSTGLDDSKE